MPNWCYTSYVIDGKRKEVQSLFSKMNNLENRRKPLVDNSFGKTWLGCLVTKLGVNTPFQHRNRLGAYERGIQTSQGNLSIP